MANQIKPIGTGKALTKEQGLSAYETLKRFCQEQECKTCVFYDSKVDPHYPCVLYRNDIPINWPHIRIE